MDLDAVAYFELPHQDLRCLRIQLFPSLVLKELTSSVSKSFRGKIKMDRFRQ